MADVPDKVPDILDTEDRRWAARIRTSWQKSVESILETGRLLIEAKEALFHGEFETMVRKQLPFGARSAQMLMAIAKHPLLSNTKHASVLPVSWMTLYDLSRMPVPELKMAILNHMIKPALERKDVPKIRYQIAKALNEPVPKLQAERAQPTFFPACKARLDNNVAAWLESLDADRKEQLIESIIQLLTDEMTDHS